NLVNSFCSGIIQTDNHRLYKTSTYYAQQLYATLAGSRPLRVETSPAGMPALDVSATLSADGRELTLFVVNDRLEDSTLTLDLSAFGTRPQTAQTWRLADRDHAGESDVTNTFGGPERVATVQESFEVPGPKFAFRFPALSLTVQRFPVEVR